MSAPSSPKNIGKIRLGCVPYLNARPLIFGIEDRMIFEPPSRLCTRLRDGQLDAALAPIVECLEFPNHRIAPGMAIGSRGTVLSVYLAHRTPLEKIRRAALDPDSRTSNLLLQVVLREFFNLTPEFVTGAAGDMDARLLIGDPALAARPSLQAEGWRILDLGEVWWRKTNLPFIYAAWTIREDVEARPLVEMLRKARQEGTTRIEEIIQAQNVTTKPEAREYLTRCIRYDLGAEEMRGIREFQRLCLLHGLIPRAAEITLAHC